MNPTCNSLWVSRPRRTGVFLSSAFFLGHLIIIQMCTLISTQTVDTATFGQTLESTSKKFVSMARRQVLLEQTVRLVSQKINFIPFTNACIIKFNLLPRSCAIAIVVLFIGFKSKIWLHHYCIITFVFHFKRFIR